jgi:ATP-binding cassette subfamily F protein uup
VRWNVAEGQEKVAVGGGERHVISYLQDFLFTPARCDQPVRSLSGGERNRLLLARLLTRPANLLVLDEPTNDLDLETLELLANLLGEFAGTVLLVSHDRRFLDEVVTSTLALDGHGTVSESVGGYADWQRQTGGWPALLETGAASGAGSSGRSGDAGARGRGVGDAPAPDRPARADTPRRLKWREARELEALPEKIETLESEQATLHAQLADPALYRDQGERVAPLQARLAELAGELEAAYTRWAELEDIAGSS